MDVALTPAAPATVRHVLASRYLAGPDLNPELGDIRLVPHQVDAAQRLLPLMDRHGGALLADATGMGKTFVALAVARAVGPTTIVAPAALRAMWSDALHRARVRAGYVSYESLSRGAGRAPGAAALLVLDEAHHARNPASRRYEVLADLAWGARVLLVTATPIHNRIEDVRALMALFLGSRAASMTGDELSELIVRRDVPRRVSRQSGKARSSTSRLPSIESPVWLEVEPDPPTLRAIESLSPAVPAVDGGTAHALLRLGLLRAWASSAAALRSTLRRRLQRAAALSESLQAGRYPTRAELASWTSVDDALQLGFTDLLVSAGMPGNVPALTRALERHCAGVREILARLDHAGATQDAARVAHLERVMATGEHAIVVAFTQFTDTAIAFYRALSPRGGVCLVTGRGARIASGRLPPAEIVRLFDDVSQARRVDPSMPARLLIASDVLSEGVSLRRAGVLVHLDLPWTLARLEQRVGRLRRLGSPHARIAVVAIGPPVSARELAAVVRALRRKCRVSALLSPRAPPESEPILGIQLGRATRVVVGKSDTWAAESVRGILTTWLGRGRRRECGNEGGVGVVASAPCHAASGSSALALVRQSSRLSLVKIDDCGVSDRPSEVLPVVRRMDCLREQVDDGPGVPATKHAAEAFAEPPDVAAICHALHEWMSLRLARALVAPATDAPSRAHARVLHLLDELISTTERAALPRVGPLLAQCRAAVIAARGMGAERAMERWLQDRGAAPTVGDAIEALTSLLASRSARRGTVAETNGSIVALLVAGPATPAVHPGAGRDNLPNVRITR